MTDPEVPRVTVDQCKKILQKGASEWSAKKVIKCLRWFFSSEKNIETFCRFFFRDAFTTDFADFHHDIIQEFLQPGNSSRAEPRGHGKSTLIGNGYVMWLIVNKRKNYIVYTSQNYRKSIEFIDPVRRNCKQNKLLRFVYPELVRLKNVRDDEGKDREDCFDVDGRRIEALSFEHDIRGLRYGVHRPDLIILDDIENRERVMNPELRIKDQQKLDSDIIPALAINGQYKMIGTILHLQSLLKKKIDLHNGKIGRAEENGVIRWPEMFTREWLDEKKKEIGSLAYAQEYLNNPAESGQTIFKRQWLDNAKDTTLSVTEPDRRRYQFKCQGVDFAFSDRITADSSAFGGIGKDYTEDGEPQVDVIQLIWKQGMSITEQLDFIEYFSGVGAYHDNALEENSIRSMSKELNKYKFPFTLYWTAASDARETKAFELDQEFPMKRHVVGKVNMIQRMATEFENGVVRLPYKTERDVMLTDKFIDECMTFALDDGKLVETGIHADMPIAIGYALERARTEKYQYNVAAISFGSDEDLPPDQQVTPPDQIEEEYEEEGYGEFERVIVP